MPEFGASKQDSDNRGANTSRLINCFRQPVGGRARYALKSVPGTETFAKTNDVFFYGASVFENNILAAIGGKLYRVGIDGSTASLGSITSGPTSISSNTGLATIAAAGSYYTLSGSVITQRTVDSVGLVGSVGYLDRYTLVTELGGDKWGWSDLADPTTFPALNFATAESSDGDLTRVFTISGRVVLFKEDSREVWYNTGLSGPDAFTRLPGGAKDTGLKDYGLVTKASQSIFWVGNDNIARLSSDGAEEQLLSYPPVDTAIATGSATECFYYEAEGNKFCVIRFDDRPAWCFDLATGEWHERAEDEDHDPWTARACVHLGNDWCTATNNGQFRKLTQCNCDALEVDREGAYSSGFDEGHLNEYDPAAPYSQGFSTGFSVDDPEIESDARPLRRTAISETIYARDGLSVDELEVFARTGFSEMDRPARLWVRFSKDGGHTWGREKWRDLGGQGDYGQKARWSAQGHFEQLTIEVNVSDPAEIPLWSDYALRAS